MFNPKTSLLRVEICIALLIMLPITILGYCTIARMRLDMINNICKANLQTQNQASISLNIIINNILDISKQVYADRTLKDILKQKNIDDYANSSYAISKMHEIQNSNSYIDSVYLYLPNSKKIISSLRGSDDFSEFGDKYFVDWYLNSKNNFAISETHPAELSKYDNEKRNVFSVFTRLPIENDNNFYGAVIINIRQSVISYNVITAMSQNKDINFYILDSKNKIIFSKDENLLYTTPSQNNFPPDDIYKDSGYFITNKNNNAYLTVYNKLLERNWTLVTVYNYEDVVKSIVPIETLIVVVILIIVLMLISFYVVITYRTINPMENLKRFIDDKSPIGKNVKIHMNGVKGIVYDTFAYNEVMEKKLRDVIPIFRENFLYDLVIKGNLIHEYVVKKLCEFSIDMPFDGVILSLLEIDNYNEISTDKDYNNSIIKLSIINIIHKYLSSIFKHFFTLETEQNKIVIVVDLVSQNIGNICESFRAICSEINKQLGISSIVVVYDTLESLCGLKSAYNNCADGMKYKYTYSVNHVILFSDISVHTNDLEEYNFPLDKIEFLTNYIRSNQKSNAFSILEYMIRKSCLNKSRLYTQHSILQINSTIMALLEEVYISPECLDVEEKELMEYIKHFNSIDEIELKCKAIIEKITDIIQKNKSSKLDKYNIQIMLYIGKNYKKQISLDDICNNIKLSPAYVTRLIKKYTHKTFVQYLNELRIDKACEILAENNNLKIMYIAEEVGFTSSKYFIKVFKELKGVTPGEFQQSKNYIVTQENNPIPVIK